MRFIIPEGARRRSAIACVLTLAALAGCSGGSDGGDAAVVTRPPVTVVAAGPAGDTDFTVVVTVTDAPFFLTDDSRVGSSCGGDRGAGTVVESSRVDLFREGDELIEGLTGPGVVDGIELTDDGAIASMTCSFGVGIDLSVTDDGPYDLIFTTGRTADAITLEKPAVTAEELAGSLELTR